MTLPIHTQGNRYPHVPELEGQLARSELALPTLLKLTSLPLQMASEFLGQPLSSVRFISEEAACPSLDH